MAPQHTFFAPAERANQETLIEDSNIFKQNQVLRDVINSIPYIGFIINKHRQLVYSNDTLIETIGARGIKELIGKRPGELLDCVNAKLEPGGCGTSEFCQVCGAAKTIMESFLTGNRASSECRIISNIGSQHIAWDFMCIATPLQTNNKTFAVLSLIDISHEKRRRALERIFFHDLINTASGLDGFLNHFHEADLQKKSQDRLKLARRLSRRLLDEIIAQRQLSSAENEELTARNESIYSLDLVSDVVNFMACNSLFKDKIIITDPESDNSHFRSDPALLRRVLVNMLKNALEACNPTEEITIGCKICEESVDFQVQNPGVIPTDIQKQIFQRSFSTKGTDRGLGTYSMRLLTEKYLKGKIGFSSNAKSGTIFRVSIPHG